MYKNNQWVLAMVEDGLPATIGDVESMVLDGLNHVYESAYSFDNTGNIEEIPVGYNAEVVVV